MSNQKNWPDKESSILTVRGRPEKIRHVLDSTSHHLSSTYKKQPSHFDQEQKRKKLNIISSIPNVEELEQHSIVEEEEEEKKPEQVAEIITHSSSIASIHSSSPRTALESIYLESPKQLNESMISAWSSKDSTEGATESSTSWKDVDRFNQRGSTSQGLRRPVSKTQPYVTTTTSSTSSLSTNSLKSRVFHPPVSYDLRTAAKSNLSSPVTNLRNNKSILQHRHPANSPNNTSLHKSTSKIQKENSLLSSASTASLSHSFLNTHTTSISSSTQLTRPSTTPFPILSKSSMYRQKHLARETVTLQDRMLLPITNDDIPWGIRSDISLCDWQHMNNKISKKSKKIFTARTASSGSKILSAAFIQAKLNRRKKRSVLIRTASPVRRQKKTALRKPSFMKPNDNVLKLPSFLSGCGYAFPSSDGGNVAKSGKGDDVKNRNNVYDSPTRVYDRMKNPCVSLNQRSVEDVPEYVSPRFKRNPRDSIQLQRDSFVREKEDDHYGKSNEEVLTLVVGGGD